jgi:hypothetical protein
MFVLQQSLSLLFLASGTGCRELQLWELQSCCLQDVTAPVQHVCAMLLLLHLLAYLGRA